jgi:hypothetical protein
MIAGRNLVQVGSGVRLRDPRSTRGSGRGDQYARNIRLIVSCVVLRQP